MKVNELLEAKKDDDEDEEDWSHLKSFKEHHYNGRIWCRGEDADAILELVHDPIDKLQPGDMSIWHDWLSDHTYEITFTADDNDAIKRVLDRVKKKFPRAHLFTAYVRDNQMIRHQDWKDY